MSINYWHIQLHPNERLPIDVIKSILKELQVIGMGESWNDKHGNPINHPTEFKRSMKIGDVVMVRDGSTPIALVKVISDSYIEQNVKDDFDWFSLRRKIELISFFEQSDAELLKRILKKHNRSHIQAPGTLTFCNGNNATNDFIIEWYKAANFRKLMENIKLSNQRQTQIKELWEKFKNEITEDEKSSLKDEIERLLTDWQLYKKKIENSTITLDEYTNTIGSATANMPGGYLCNFLERTTKRALGSSKPGNAYNFEVKLNTDNETYYIREGTRENVSKEVAVKFFDDNIKGLLKRIVTKNDPLEIIGEIDKAQYTAKQILMKLAVLDNLADFIFIYSEQTIDELYDEFIDGDEDSVFSKSHQLSIIIKKILDINTDDKVELILLSRFLWKYVNAKSIADVDTPNVILYGPPGTGKTYSVVNSLDFVCQGDSSRYEFIQFHPSFTYEDFIEGIKPKGVSASGNISFELINGVFKNFCKKAKDNPEKTYYFVVDEINRANLSSVFGETLSLLEKDYRHDGKSSKNLIKTQYSSLIEDLIKEDEKYKSLAYLIDEGGDVKFGVPSNIFFIGMMNDVDKSIDTFDLALRRRFKWIRKDCDYEVIEENTLFKNKENFTNIDTYIRACETLNKYISKDLGLGQSYEFGHSFFMKMSDIAKRKEITSQNLETLFNLYLRPTLKEYLRAVFVESELDNRLSDALITFKNKFK